MEGIGVQLKQRPILTIFQAKDFGDIVAEEIVASTEKEIIQRLLLRLDLLKSQVSQLQLVVLEQLVLLELIHHL